MLLRVQAPDEQYLATGQHGSLLAQTPNLSLKRILANNGLILTSVEIDRDVVIWYNKIQGTWDRIR